MLSKIAKICVPVEKLFYLYKDPEKYVGNALKQITLIIFVYIVITYLSL